MVWCDRGGCQTFPVVFSSKPGSLSSYVNNTKAVSKHYRQQHLPRLSMGELMQQTNPQPVAKDVMNPVPPVLREGPVEREVAMQLLSGLFSGVPVVSAHGEFRGMVTNADILQALRAGKELSALMTEDVMTASCVVYEETPLECVMVLMTQEKVRQLPVLRDGQLVGVVTRAQAIESLLDRPTSETSISCCWCERVGEVKRSSCPHCSAPYHPVRERDESPARQSSPRAAILVVDDDPSISLPVSQLLISWGYHALTAANGHQGLALVEQYPVRGILLDLEMPRMGGWTMLDELRWRNYQMPVVIMSSGETRVNPQEVTKEGAQGCLLKPFTVEALAAICRQVFGQAEESFIPEVREQRTQALPGQESLPSAWKAGSLHHNSLRSAHDSRGPKESVSQKS
ncbi:MAG: response regulator [Nitrospirae bacterium]|nr:MAG: response regulator [Nitrospirota bacterium]